MKDCLAIGMMSGSSLDGVDVVAVNFSQEDSKYLFDIVAADTLPYPTHWEQALSEAFHASKEALASLDKSYGTFLGELARTFINKHHLHPDFVASHGHTIFHQPEKRFTLQIGDGQCLADSCGIMVINDFRTEDVAKGGQGAPLVPIGDKMLFNQYPLCLNIGGIANISYDKEGKRIAYDICIANQALNYLAQKVGLAYDKDGLIAEKGQIIPSLLRQLSQPDFFQQVPPKSLGREFFETQQKPLLNDNQHPVEDLMATFVEHIALTIAQSTQDVAAGEMLVTGGGALNRFLMKRIQKHCQHKIVIPSKLIIDYKEALIFAFLGFLKQQGKINVLASVTGAPSDSSSGKIWFPKNGFF